MSAVIYVEGGGNRNSDRVRCREGFRKLFEKSGFEGRMPRLVACGARSDAYDDFKTAHAKAAHTDFIGLLVDSEDAVADPEKTWQHVGQRPGDNWPRPNGANDEQLLFMTTSMETWIITDRAALTGYFGPNFKVAALPPVRDMERRHRRAILGALENASSDCPAPYRKGPRSFELLSKLNPDALEQHLPSFRRARRILNQKL